MSGIILEITHDKDFFVLQGQAVEHWNAAGELVYNGLLNAAPASVIEPLLELKVIKAN